MMCKALKRMEWTAYQKAAHSQKHAEHDQLTEQ